MKDRIDEGSWTWKQLDNHNKLMELQKLPTSDTSNQPIELAYYGGSAFKITTPLGISIMIDPWRNPPWGNWDWYLYDFPATMVDIGVSTHAHFDHDGLHFLSASVVLDRPIGTYEIADVKIAGFADKHASDTSQNVHNWADKTRRLTNLVVDPPNNCRSFDNVILLVETAGMRILHWGDNRHNPADWIWDRIQDIDIALLPIDDSQHIMSYHNVERVVERLQAKIIVPHHYYIWNVTSRASTLRPPNGWMEAHSNSEWLASGTATFVRDEVTREFGKSVCFGENVAFPVPRTSTSLSRVGA